MNLKTTLSVAALALLAYQIPALGQASEDKPLTKEEIEEVYRKGQADWDAGDPIAAMPKLKKAANAGHPVAQYLYGYTLDAADEDVQAVGYYRKAADQGNLDAMFALSGFHVSGDADVKKDLAAARDLLERAADKGHYQSIASLVMSLNHGGLGFTTEERNGAVALKWYKRGADLDIVPALEKLSEAYLEGKLGLGKDPEEAERLRIKAFNVMGIDPYAKKKRQRR